MAALTDSPNQRPSEFAEGSEFLMKKKVRSKFKKYVCYFRHNENKNHKLAKLYKNGHY